MTIAIAVCPTCGARTDDYLSPAFSGGATAVLMLLSGWFYARFGPAGFWLLGAFCTAALPVIWLLHRRLGRWRPSNDPARHEGGEDASRRRMHQRQCGAHLHGHDDRMAAFLYTQHRCPKRNSIPIGASLLVRRALRHPSVGNTSGPARPRHGAYSVAGD